MQLMVPAWLTDGAAKNPAPISKAAIAKTATVLLLIFSPSVVSFGRVSLTGGTLTR